MNKTIYEKIMRLIERQQLTKHQVEVNAGLGNGTIESWKTSSPSVATLERVCGILGTTTVELLREES